MGQSPTMHSPPSPRRRAALLRLLFLVALSLAALLAFVTSTPSSASNSDSSPARRALQLHPPRRNRHPLTTLRAVRKDDPIRPTSPGAAPRALGQGHRSSDDSSDIDAVLLPDWEVLVLLGPDNDDDDLTSGNATCAFPGGATSPARSLPASGRRAYTCVMPRPERRHSRPFRAPRLVVATLPSSAAADEDAAPAAAAAARSLTPEMMRWSDRLVYDSAALAGDDGVLVFAKGVNPRQGVNRDAADVRCIYYRRGSSGSATATVDVVASLPAATSAQQVFRCPPPPPNTAASPAEAQQLRVTLAVAGEDPIPSVATYSPRPPTPDAEPSKTTTSKKKLICACTMVRDVAKFLREWVVYHAAVGVDRFYLYDNGSGGDDLEGQVRQLSAEGFHVSTHAWPWPKTQEAGFSYAAAAHQDWCEWMAFVDVDEFIFSPDWAGSGEPTKSMLRSIVTAVEPDVGQVTLGCKDFGPSGRTKHPKEGVTQGYTCRRRAEERHKSLVRLDSVAPSLMNSVHHFELRPEFKWERSRDARVNHYKYQAWDEFKVKFRRRVSTYVADWTDRINHGSKDRTPGLGFEAVEPAGWPHKFCEVEDTLLRDVTRRWFGVGFTNKLAHHRPVGGTTHSSS